MFAGIFKWVDENGKTHYTNSRAKIPRKYRQSDKVQSVRSTRGGKEKLQTEEKVEEPPAEVLPEKVPEDNKQADNGAPGEDSATVQEDPAPQIDPETQAKMDQINKVIEYFNNDNKRIEQLIKGYPKQGLEGGGYLAWSNRREARRSKALAEELYEAGYSELEEIASHLWDGAEKAEDLKIDKSDEFKKLVPELYRNGREQMRVQKQFIKEMEKTLKDLGRTAG